MPEFSTPRAPAQAQGPKQMSSRLLTMKFMQRAAAASSSASSPSSSPNTTPYSEPSSKRRKVTNYNSSNNNKNNNNSYYSSSAQSSAPGTPTQDFTDRGGKTATATAASAAEPQSQRKAEVKARNAREGNETEWILDINLPTSNTAIQTGKINSSGAEGDDSDEDEEGEFYKEDHDDDIWTTGDTPGRQTYGSFKRKTKNNNSDNNTAKSHPVGGDQGLGDLSSVESRSGSDDEQVFVSKRTGNLAKSAYGSPLSNLGLGQRGSKSNNAPRLNSKRSKRPK